MAAAGSERDSLLSGGRVRRRRPPEFLRSRNNVVASDVALDEDAGYDGALTVGGSHSGASLVHPSASHGSVTDAPDEALTDTSLRLVEDHMVGRTSADELFAHDMLSWVICKVFTVWEGKAWVVWPLRLFQTAAVLLVGANAFEALKGIDTSAHVFFTLLTAAINLMPFVSLVAALVTLRERRLSQLFARLALLSELSPRWRRRIQREVAVVGRLVLLSIASCTAVEFFTPNEEGVEKPDAVNRIVNSHAAEALYVAQKETEVLTATMAPRHRRVQEAAPIAAIKQCCSCRDDERGRESTPSRLREERVKFLRFVLDPSGRGLFEAPLDPNDVRNASDQLLARVVAEHKDGPDAPGRQRVALLGFEEFRVAYARVIYFYRRNAGVFSTWVLTNTVLASVIIVSLIMFFLKEGVKSLQPPSTITLSPLEAVHFLQEIVVMVGSYIMVLRALTLVPAAQAVMRSRIATQLPGATPQQLQERIAFHDFLSSQRTPVRIFGVGVDRYLLAKGVYLVAVSGVLAVLKGVQDSHIT